MDRGRHLLALLGRRATSKSRRVRVRVRVRVRIRVRVRVRVSAILQEGAEAPLDLEDLTKPGEGWG